MNIENDNTVFRSFIAFELPAEIKKFCISLQKELSKNKVYAKWTQPGNHHLTINFLGEQNLKRLHEINSNILNLNIDLSSIKFKISGIGFFGKPPKIIFVKIVDTDRNADSIVKEIEKINNLKSEFADWLPHLTLGRFKNIKDSMTLKKELLIKTFNLDFSPEKITVFTSELTKYGPIYKAVDQIIENN